MTVLFIIIYGYLKILLEAGYCCNERALLYYLVLFVSLVEVE